MRLGHVINAMQSAVWMMEPRYLERVATVVLAHHRGDAAADAVARERLRSRASSPMAMDDEWDQPTKTAPRERYAMLPGGVALVRADGVLSKYASQVDTASGARGASYETLVGDVRAARADSRTRAMVVQIDSPGGTAWGVETAALVLREVAGAMPLVVHVDDMAYSAGYYLASQGSHVMLGPGAGAGSIGVYTVMLDSSKWHEQRGLAVKVVKHGAHKAVGVDGVPISDADIAEMQREIDQYAALFRRAVVRGRPALAGSIDALMDGRIHLEDAALNLGLADSVGTLEQAAALARRMSERGVGGDVQPAKVLRLRK